MDFGKVAQKSFSVVIPSQNIEVFGTGYTLNDEITLAGLYQLDDLRFFYAGLANLIAEKYSIDPNILSKLTPVDIQYMFLELKKNSDGNKLSIKFNCPDEKCNTSLEAQIDLDKIKIKNQSNFTKVLDVDSSTKIAIGVPSYSDYFNVISEFKNIGENDYQKIISKNIDLFKISIKSIITGDSITEITPEIRKSEDFNKFFTTGLRKQYKQFEVYLNDESPELIYPEHIICASCNKKINLGIDDFFYSAL